MADGGWRKKYKMMENHFGIAKNEVAAVTENYCTVSYDGRTD
jgi:hypothetical protein